MELNKITIINVCHIDRIKYLQKFMYSLKDISCNKLCCVNDKALINFDTYGFKILDCLGNYIDRTYFCLKNTTTKYIIQCSEDDLYNIDYIIQSIKFLDNNPEYISTWGLSLKYNQNKMSIDKNSIMADKYIACAYNHYHYHDKIKSCDPLVRIMNYYNLQTNYSMTQNVLLTKITCNLYEFLHNNKDLQSWSYHDKFNLIYFLMFGNIYMLDTIQCLRSVNISISGSSLEENLGHKNWNTFFEHSDIICNFLHKETNIDKTNITKMLNNLKHWKHMLNITTNKRFSLSDNMKKDIKLLLK